MRICVFCGSARGFSPEYTDAAAGMGKLLAQRGIGLVYGGASVGTMGVVADAALAAGGEVIGVIPEVLSSVEIAHGGLTELHVVADMHQRKAKMAELSDAFVALPGGAGTLEELFEVWTWAQLGIHRKPIGLLDVAGYYTPLVAFADHMQQEGFLRPETRALLTVDSDAAALLDRFAAQ
ncbi:TIGR00730 family Rossman fold protein [Amycolatopsis jejuensis]|uniref:LOG family protein n=1 Tax=Amycolatopsis jejuensis TaxID=330084 RepID=UPI000ABFED10|nr:TIGR00730 family Rossman fold protein [Amycolatopsis jejuensis]